MFTDHQTTEALLDTAGTGLWHYAPKHVIAAQQAADTAHTAQLDADLAVEDAEHALFLAEQDYATEGRKAVAEGKPLPSRDEFDRARFDLDNKKVAAAKAAANVRLERNALAVLLSDADIRNAWRTTIQTAAEKHKQTILQIANDVVPLQAELTRMAALTYYLGAWTSHITLPQVTKANPATALFELGNVKTWTPPQPLDQTTRWATPLPLDDRPSVWITNPTGKTHAVSAADAERLLQQPGYRPAAEAEVRGELRRQGINA